MARVHTAGGDRHRTVHSEIRAPIEVMLARVVNVIFTAIEVILALRFVLRLFGANPAAGFTQFVYGLSSVFMAPFTAVFPTAQVEAAAFEWSVLVAMVVYGLILWLILALINALTPRESASTLESYESDDTGHHTDY